MPTLRRFALLLGLAPVGACVALAASLGVADRSLGVAWTGTPRCTSAGLGVIQNLSALTVVSVTVSGLPSGCGNATLQVTVNNTLTSSSGSATVPAGGGSVTVALAAAVAIGTAEEVDLILTGP
jgi:hypothetical protein